MIERAMHQCEYCLIDGRCVGAQHEVDHICAEKHGGETTSQNLCLSCFDYNRHKGSDLCSMDAETAQIVSLFHPRLHQWDEHFRLTNAFIEPLTATGRVTAQLLQMNVSIRLEERVLLFRVGKYPDYKV